jgi:hypothetical protein
MTMILAVLVVWSFAGCGNGDGTATAVAATGDGATADVGVADAPPGDDPEGRGSGPDLSVLGQGSLEGRDLVIWFWAGY